jgi:hypothetical protein
MILASSLAAQQPARLEAGAGAGGSVFGWQPRVGVAGSTKAILLGALSLDWHGALARVAMPSSSMHEAQVGARLSLVRPSGGWWAAGDAFRRSGFKDVIERPSIETGGWRQLGNFVLTVSAARRSAAVQGISYFTHTSTSYFRYLDTISGRWDSTLVTRTVGDSARASALRRWAETEAGLSWDGRLLSAALVVGGRLASRGVPSGGWASTTLAVRLSSPLSLVVGAGTASGGRFALDGEHRYVTFGLRVRPRLASVATDDRSAPAATASELAVVPLGGGEYELSLVAPRAHRVEISGDFTNWKPVALMRAPGWRWILTRPLTAGMYRLNARLDGGSWIVPPGLTTMSDDFAGEVGLLLIERREEDTRR